MKERDSEIACLRETPYSVRSSGYCRTSKSPTSRHGLRLLSGFDSPQLSISLLLTSKASSSDCPSSFKMLQSMVYNTSPPNNQNPTLSPPDLGNSAPSQSADVLLCAGSSSSRRSSSRSSSTSSQPRGIVKVYKCYVCSSRFLSKADRTTHFNNRHPHPPFQCAECGYSFSNKLRLEQHVAREHPIIYSE